MGGVETGLLLAQSGHIISYRALEVGDTVR